MYKNHLIDCSINEIEAIIKKIMYVQRRNWGEAIEIASAMKRLASYQFLFSNLFIQYLEKIEEKNAKIHQEYPFQLGIHLNDFCFALEDNKVLKFEKVSFPLFIIPWLEKIAHKLNKSIQFNWDDTLLTINGNSIKIDTDQQLYKQNTESITLTFTPKINDCRKNIFPNNYIYQMTSNDFQKLCDYANIMNVPINEKSQKDAGSALIDDNT